MWQFIQFIKTSLAQITGMLDKFSFDLGGINVSIFDLLIGFIGFGLIISVFWKGART